MARPQRIGIKAMELYFPNQCVDQNDLEKHDGVSTGKYTIGLGQTRMGFCDDREDIYSLALTTVSSLLKKYSIDKSRIGRLEVGTETMLDKSKSVKSVLMQLFEPYTNIEGVDTVNACYGGTNALFNTVAWMESSAWDGRDAIVVAGDIALYAAGNARPTGGVGCVAMLIGPNAPIVVEPGLRGTYMRHVYDFYKPDFNSEYPVVHGHFSLQCYTEAVDKCYRAYNARERQLAQTPLSPEHGILTNSTNSNTNGDVTLANGHPHINGSTQSNGNTDSAEPHSPTRNAQVPLDRFDYMAFHAPSCKLVNKSYARLLYNDYLEDPSNPLFADVPERLRDMPYEQSLVDKEVEKTFMGLAKKRFAARVQPAITAPTMCGNMYTASVYGALISIMSLVPLDQLAGKRVGIFSYGSGLASSLFSLRIEGDVSEMVEKIGLMKKLDAREVLSPVQFGEFCDLREKAHQAKNFTPAGSIDRLLPGTWYLTGVDDQFRRSYAIKQ